MKIEGEIDPYSVFKITFADECVYIGYTSQLIVGRVEQICAEDDPTGIYARGTIVGAAQHHAAMSNTVQCLASDIREQN